MSARHLDADTAALQQAATDFAASAGRVDQPGTAADPGPAWQPSSAAVTALSDGTEHVTAECVKRLLDYAEKLAAAATAYTQTDWAAADPIAATIPVD